MTRFTPFLLVLMALAPVPAETLQPVPPGRVKLLNPTGSSIQPGDEEEDWVQGSRTGHLWLKNLYVRA